MIVDLSHNKIVAESMSDAFKDCVDKTLIPLISEKYADATVVGIQMYEDYISDGFFVENKFYYPLTVVTEEGAYTEWVTWTVDARFERQNPYAFAGEGVIDFETTVDVPSDFEDKLIGRARFCEDGIIKINVEAAETDYARLSGKYSQTFVDEMARQLTRAIEEATSVSGLADSGLEFSLVFAPGTYMEHISENVTYRRLVLNDGASAPRDFWVKWTRLDGAVAYSVAENADGENVVFELGEDVSQKIREKEYRYLVGEGKVKYHNAMGRKNVTEWREIIKRAIRRGDLVKIDKADELSPEALEAARKLADVLGKTVSSEAEDDSSEIRVSSEFEEAMQKVREIAMNASTDDDADVPVSVESSEIVLDFDMDINEVLEELDESKYTKKMEEITSEGFFFEEEEDEEEAEDEELDELEDFYSDEDTSVGDGIVSSNDEEATEIDEITRLALEALEIAKSQNEERADEDESVEFEEIDDEDSYADEPVAQIDEADEDAEEEIEIEIEIEDEADSEEEAPAVPECVEEEALTEIAVDLSARESEIRAEIEAKIRYEYESNARKKAEEEIEKLRSENERIRTEFEKQLSAAKREIEMLRAQCEKLKEEKRRIETVAAAQEAVRRAEEEKLRAQIELQLRTEARERERLAEAARIAIEEQQRLERERAEEERLRVEETRRLEEEQRRAEEAARLEAARLAEAERIRLETEKARAEAAKAALEASPEANYTYTSKLVRLIFRRSVDPNITKRIHEIIKATIDYYAKNKMFLKIRATVPDSQTVCLEFVQIPMEEMELLNNIIKILGNSGLGIAKAIVE